MAKEIRGWRYDNEPLGKSLSYLTAFQSDDGWHCPYCKTMVEPRMASGLDSQAYFSLMEMGEAVELGCPNCDKTHQVKAVVTRKFYSCEDIKFEEDRG